MAGSAKRAAFPRMISQFLRQRGATVLPPRDLERLDSYLQRLIRSGILPPRVGGRPDWQAIAEAVDLDQAALAEARATLEPALDAICRFLGPTASEHARGAQTKTKLPKQPNVPAPSARRSNSKSSPEWRWEETATAAAARSGRPRCSLSSGRRRGKMPKPVVEFPEAQWAAWEEPLTFSEALKLHMDRHSDSVWHLHRAVVQSDEPFDHKTFTSWIQGTKTPRAVTSFEILGRIERRYRLPSGYFKAKLAHPNRATSGHHPANVTPSQRRRLAWHLPDDFDRRPPHGQEEILKWVQENIISGGTDYRRFQALALRNRYAVRFPGILDHDLGFDRPLSSHQQSAAPNTDDIDTEGATNVAVDAPRRLWLEMSELLRFKTATLTTIGFQRVGVWGDETAAQKVEHFGLLFGSLAAPKRSAVQGLGIPLEALTFAMLVFPAVWDWYLTWREKRRGFYTSWEVDMLRIALALTRAETGWLRQRPDLAFHIQAIPALISEAEMLATQSDWDAACDLCQKHCAGRIKEIQRVAKVHRDPFEPILPILEADSPVGEYRKIADEILKMMPDECRYPVAAAEATRSFLIIRLGLHTGLRQKNLRQLLLCPRGRTHTSERQLEDMKVGELRWSERDQGWEVFIPAAAFKNASSSYFGDKPFRLVLPNIGDFYYHLEAYVGRHRLRLLKGAHDPGTFFVKTMKVNSVTAAYDQTTFFEAWRLIIQRYAIYNPYTGRGVIKGLLPHGPHNVRDVLATHILKQTGSYEQASYAIQDTPDMVAKHYGRFLPQDKAALAARILNQVWNAA